MGMQLNPLYDPNYYRDGDKQHYQSLDKRLPVSASLACLHESLHL